MDLRETILNNWRWKMFSLLLALLIWFAIQPHLNVKIFRKEGGDTPTATTPELDTEFWTVEVNNVEVGILVPPEHEGVFRIRPDKVRIILEGDKSVFNSFTAREVRERLHAFVDLTSLAGNSAERTNSVARQILVEAPSGLRPQSIEPATVLVERIVPARNGGAALQRNP